MAIRDRITDAKLLWASGRREGAFLLVLIALAATARKRYPHPRHKDGDSFRTYLSDHMPRLTGKILLMPVLHWSLTFRGQEYQFEEFLYRFMRCELAHQAEMPPDVRFGYPAIPVPILPDAGGLMIHPALVVALSEVVVDAAENDGKFPDPAPNYFNLEI